MQSRFILGFTFSETLALSAFPASAGWSVELRLIPRTGADGAITLTSTADGDSHLIEADAATTSSWVAGEYAWIAAAVLGDERKPAGSGAITFAPDPFTAGAPLDTRTPSEVALADAKAALAAWKPTTKRYKINGREMEFNSPADIIAVVSFWTQEVAREQTAARATQGLASKRKIYGRVGRA
jgi:hypothetical protein